MSGPDVAAILHALRHATAAERVAFCIELLAMMGADEIRAFEDVQTGQFRADLAAAAVEAERHHLDRCCAGPSCVVRRRHVYDA